jgi:hypothetical protein
MRRWVGKAQRRFLDAHRGRPSFLAGDSAARRLAESLTRAGLMERISDADEYCVRANPACRTPGPHRLLCTLPGGAHFPGPHSALHDGREVSWAWKPLPACRGCSCVTPEGQSVLDGAAACSCDCHQMGEH